MDNDSAFLLLIVVLFPIAVAVLASLIVLVQRSVSTTTCPTCQKTIPKTAITQLGVECESCIERQKPRPVPQAATCNHCDRQLDTTPCIHLWDDRNYCEECVSAAGGGVLQYASQHSLLKETILFPAWKPALQIFLLCFLSINALFGTIAFLAGLTEGGVADGFLYLAMTQLLVLPVTTLFAGATGLSFAMNRPSIWVHEGQLTVKAGTLCATHPLHQCEWFVGSSAEMNLFEKVPIPAAPAVVIVLPREEAEQEKFVAVGLTDETRARWMAFLELAKILRRSAWERPRSRSRKWLNAVVAVIALPLIFCIGLATSSVLMLLIKHVTGDRDLAVVIGTVVFMPGTVYALLYFAFLWPWRSIKRVASRRTNAERQKIRRKFILPIATVSLLVSMGFLQIPLKVHARIIGIVLTIATGCLFGYDLGKRYANLEWARTDEETQ